MYSPSCIVHPLYVPSVVRVSNENCCFSSSFRIGFVSSALSAGRTRRAFEIGRFNGSTRFGPPESLGPGRPGRLCEEIQVDADGSASSGEGVSCSGRPHYDLHIPEPGSMFNVQCLMCNSKTRMGGKRRGESHCNEKCAFVMLVIEDQGAHGVQV